MLNRIAPLIQAICLLAMALANVPLVYGASPNSFLINPGSNSQFSSQVRPPADYVDAVNLSANAAKSMTVPATARFVILSATCNFYANKGGTATVPGDVDDGTASTLNPAGWFLGPVGTYTSISFIAESACHITGDFYR